MKKALVVLLAVLTLVASVGCNSTTPETNAPETNAPEVNVPEEPKASTDVTMWRIGTASMTGNSFTMGSQIAQMINETVDSMEAAAQSTGGSADNCYLLDEKEVEVGLVNGTAAKQALTGTESFEGNAITSMRAMGIYGLGVEHIIVNNSSDITGLKDLTGKTLGVGPMGGGTETITDFLLAEFGVTDYKKIYGSMSESLDAVKMGEVDAVIYETTLGAANLTDLLNSGKCHLIGMTAEEAADLAEKYPEYNAYTISANSYSDQLEDVYTIVSPSLILTREDISEDSVYTFVKALYENYDSLVAQNAMFRDMTPEAVAAGTSIELHPGAEKYFKEIGALK